MKTVAKNLFYATASASGTGALIGLPFEWWELPRVALLFTAFSRCSPMPITSCAWRVEMDEWGLPVAHVDSAW